MAKRIFISPSNQTDNKYASGGTNEEVQMVKLANELEKVLKRCGFETKRADSLNMQNRVQTSNSWGANAHICLHSNACNKEVMGTRMLYWSKLSNGYKLDKAIAKYLFPLSIGKSDNYNDGSWIYEVKYTKMPCSYIEVEFHDTKAGAEWIINNTKKIAEAIAKGICDYFKVKYVEETPTKLYRVQVGAFAVKSNAEKLVKELEGKGYKAFIV